MPWRWWRAISLPARQRRRCLTDGDGVEHKAEITYSDLQNVKAKFDVALPAGEYTLCVYTRSGMGDEFGVKKATRKVTVK